MCSIKTNNTFLINLYYHSSTSLHHATYVNFTNVKLDPLEKLTTANFFGGSEKLAMVNF